MQALGTLYYVVSSGRLVYSVYFKCKNWYLAAPFFRANSVPNYWILTDISYTSMFSLFEIIKAGHTFFLTIL